MGGLIMVFCLALIVVDQTKITLFHKASRKIYGSPRIHGDLVDSGEAIGINRVARLMKRHGIQSKMARKFVITTDSKNTMQPAPDQLQRNFKTDTPELHIGALLELVGKVSSDPTYWYARHTQCLGDIVAFLKVSVELGEVQTVPIPKVIAPSEEPPFSLAAGTYFTEV